MAFRDHLSIWVFLIFLFTFSNATTTIIKTHVTSTSITVNENSEELLSVELRLVARNNSPHQGADKRQVHNPSDTPASGHPAGSGLIFLVGTHAVTFTGGEVKSIDGTAFSLDPQSRTLYAKGSPYYVPVRPEASSNTFVETSPLPAASNDVQSSAVESNVSRTVSVVLPGESSSMASSKDAATSGSSTLASTSTTRVLQPSRSTSTTSEGSQSRSIKSEADTNSTSTTTTTGSTNVGSSIPTSVTSETLTSIPQNSERTSRSENAQASASSSDRGSGTGISIITSSTTATRIGGFSSFTNSSASANTPAFGIGPSISSNRSSSSFSPTRSDSRGPKSILSISGSTEAPTEKSSSKDNVTGGSSVQTDSRSNTSDEQKSSVTFSPSRSGSNGDTRGTSAPSSTPTRSSVSGQLGATTTSTGQPTSSVAPPQEVTLETVASASLVSCKPPCTLTLPPIPLNTPAVLEYPAITTSICTNFGNIVYTYVTTISVSAATISELSLKPIPISPMSSDQPAVTSAADAQYPLGICSMVLPAGNLCSGSHLPDSTDGKCGIGDGNETKCPGMQCCSSSGQCGTDKGAWAKESGCQSNYGVCWPDGQQSFLPLSEVFGPATITSDCPVAIRPSLPTAGPIIAGASNQTADVPTATQSSTTGVIPPPIVIPGQTTQGPVPVPVPVPVVPPGIPRLCGACGINMDPFQWTLDIGCSGPLCDTVKPKGGGCHGPLCDIFKCHVGCDGGKGGGGGGGGKPPPPSEEEDEPPEEEDQPDPPEDQSAKPTVTPTRPSGTPVTEKPTKSSSESSSECETTMTATDVTAFCNIVTQFGNFGNTSSFAAPQTTCTSTKKRVTEGCEVRATTTSVFDSCSKTQTATDVTKYRTESVSGGVTYTPCTKTASTVFEGCSVTATTTSVVDEGCQAMVTLAPEDPQGEFGSLPKNDTCPFYPGVEISPLDDQGQDGQKDNDTCSLFNGTRPTIDDDQGDDGIKGCKAKNGTSTGSGSGGGSCPASIANLVQGPDGAEDGSESCPMNSTITYEPEGDLEGDEAPSCNASMSNMNVTLDMDLGQGEDGVAPGSCSLNSTLEVDNVQGEDGSSERGCPVPPDGMIISPLADQGDYGPMNDSCPILDPRYPVSPMDEQGGDRRPQVSACPIPNITIEEIPDDPLEQNPTSSTLFSEGWSAFISAITATKTPSSSTGCAIPTSSGLGKCSLVLPGIKTAHPSKSIQTSSDGPKEIKALPNAPATSQAASDGPKRISVAQSKKLAGATEGPEEIDLGKSSILAEASQAQSGMIQARQFMGNILGWDKIYSCACESQKPSQTVGATMVCGTPMCPNWVRPTSSSEESVSHPPDLPTLPSVTTVRYTASSLAKTSKDSSAPPPVTTSEYKPCQCNVPRVYDIGKCSTLVTDAPLWSMVDMPTLCLCELASGKIGTFSQTTTCGQAVCPNQKEETTLSVPSVCPETACVPPLTTAHGLCSLNSHTYKSGGAWKTGWECACDGQHGSLVNVQTGCNGSPVCPNQAEMVTRITPHWTSMWTDGMPQEWKSECWTTLPSLLYFDQCTLSSVKGATVAPYISGYPACFCDVKGDDELRAMFKPLYSGCGGGWLCPNSQAIPTSVQKERRAYEYEELRQLPNLATATAVGPLTPVVTDATPGSAAVAVSEPTKAAVIKSRKTEVDRFLFACKIPTCIEVKQV